MCYWLSRFSNLVKRLEGSARPKELIKLEIWIIDKWMTAVINNNISIPELFWLIYYPKYGLLSLFLFKQFSTFSLIFFFYHNHHWCTRSCLSYSICLVPKILMVNKRQTVGKLCLRQGCMSNFICTKKLLSLLGKFHRESMKTRKDEDLIWGKQV